MTLISKFNDGRPLNKTMVTTIEDFFDFYWKNDRLRALKSPADVKITDELQDTFMQHILMEFLFVDFLYIFKKSFINDEDAVIHTQNNLRMKK